MARRALVSFGIALPAALVLFAPATTAVAHTAHATCGSTATATGSYTQSSGTTSLNDQAYTASTADSDAVQVSGGTFNLSQATITKTGDTSSDDNSSFYGLNAAILAESGGVVNLDGVSVTTDGTGANGVFATGSASVLTMRGCSITATADGSHGADATAGATLSLDHVDISTSGGHSSAVATDRGGGTVTVHGGNIEATGSKSAGLYSTGDVTVYDAKVTSGADFGAVMDGANTLTLHNTDLSGYGGGFMLWNTVGQPESTAGAAVLDGGSLTVSNGDAFYATNDATAAFTVEGGAKVTQSGALLAATSTSNGTLTALDGEYLTGAVTADSTSTAALVLEDGSRWSGPATSAALTLAGGSEWSASADSTLTTLTGAVIDGTHILNIIGNSHTVTYDASLTANAALADGTYTLVGGGTLKPAS